MKLLSKGQSTVEFVLIAPLLFVIFFATVQLSYVAFAYFAVQRAALAVARIASLGGINNPVPFKPLLAISLMPLSRLSPKTLLTILSSECKVSESLDKRRINVWVRYPMPIWVPGVCKILGHSLVPAANFNDSPEGRAVKSVLVMLKEPEPDLSFKGVQLPVYWINFETSTFNEAHGYPHETE